MTACTALATLATCSARSERECCQLVCQESSTFLVYFSLLYSGSVCCLSKEHFTWKRVLLALDFAFASAQPYI